MKGTWVDSTSYSRDDKERVPNTWTLTLPETKLRITVTKGHVYSPGKWVMHCFELGIDTKPLQGVPPDDVDAAKHIAIVSLCVHCRPFGMMMQNGR